MTNTADSGAGSLRQAILDSNSHSGKNNIEFEIPASTAPDQNIPVSGFDPTIQTWRIVLASPLPALTNPVTIDGFSQAESSVPYRYPAQFTSNTQALSLSTSVTGGTFTLSTAAPLPIKTTGPIPYNADATAIQAALQGIVGSGNVTVTGGPLPGSAVTIAFQGALAGVDVPTLTADGSNLVGGPQPLVTVSTLSPGGQPSGLPTFITSQPNTDAALVGNTGQDRVIVDGSQINRQVDPDPTGFVIASSNSSVRGLMITGFAVSVAIPSPTDVGDLIQGNSIGGFFLYPVDPLTGQALAAPNNVTFASPGNSLQGIVLDSTNATVGGAEPQDANLINSNGQQGVWIEPGAVGNQVLGNQIGIAGPSINGLYVAPGNGGDGVLVEASSNTIGGATAGAGNIISANGGAGVHIVGANVVENQVEGNYIGVGPGGGYRFGAGDPGNHGDGVLIEDSDHNTVGGSAALQRNVISSNGGSGVRVVGASATGNVILNNIIGLTSDGVSALGNAQDGVTLLAPGNTVGPGNVISANLRGVLISGPDASGNQVSNNLIGTDGTGSGDLGNALEGVRINSAANNAVTGNAQGSQVISGNNVGLTITGVSATGNVVQGNLIGSDRTGMLPLGNSQQGILIDNAPGNTIGGTSATVLNLVSANNEGIQIQGSSAASNVIQGNLIGTNITGTAGLSNGNELDGVLVRQGALNNQIGGAVGAGNTIAFNSRDGVRVEDNSTSNAILTNAIFQNGQRGGLGIDLVPLAPGVAGPGPNHLQSAPTLTAVLFSPTSTTIQGTLQSAPNTVYTLQFFSNATLDPSGQAEGQTFLGQTTVTTDASGRASFSAVVPGLVSAGQFVTATATDPFSNTSEFSGSTIGFSMSTYAVLEGSGLATITVVRLGGGGTETVAYATANGTGQAGVDYVATSGTLTFNPGQTVATFTIPVLFDPENVSGKTVLLSLSNPTGGASLATPSTAVLTIENGTPPRVVSLVTVPGPTGVSTILVTFSKPLDPQRAVNLINYGYSVQVPGHHRRQLDSIHNIIVGLTSAVYDPATQTVALTTSAPIHPGTPILVTINQDTDNPSAGVGVADLVGNLLAGNNSGGRPGGVFSQTVIAAQPAPRPPARQSAVEQGARPGSPPPRRPGPAARSPGHWPK